MRRDVGGHTDGDAGGSIEQQIWQARWQDHRLRFRPVVVRAERDGILVDFAYDRRAQRSQSTLRIAHRRRGVAVQGAEVAVSVDQGIPQGEGLRHPDQGVVERRVAVRMVAAHDVPDYLG